MNPFSAGFTDELEKVANVLERPLAPTAGYHSDTKHFGAPEHGGPQGAGGDLLGPDGKPRPDHEAEGGYLGPIKVANDPVQAKRVVKGVRCSIEWPKGTKRKYMDKKNPKKVNHEKLMKADYGYIPGTKDADGEQLDVYVGTDLDSDKVFIIKQLKDDGSFDEHKVMMGYDSLADAKKSYLDHMPPKRLGSVEETTTEKFKAQHLASSKKNFRKAASLDTLALLGVPIKKSKPDRRKNIDQEDCAACSAADGVDEPTPGASGAEAHF